MNENLEDLNGTPEQKIPLKEDQQYLTCTGYTTTFKYNITDANECDHEKPNLWQKFLNLFKRDE